MQVSFTVGVAATRLSVIRDQRSRRVSTLPYLSVVLANRHLAAAINRMRLLTQRPAWILVNTLAPTGLSSAGPVLGR